MRCRDCSYMCMYNTLQHSYAMCMYNTRTRTCTCYMLLHYSRDTYAYMRMLHVCVLCAYTRDIYAWRPRNSDQSAVELAAAGRACCVVLLPFGISSRESVWHQQQERLGSFAPALVWRLECPCGFTPLIRATRRSFDAWRRQRCFGL